MKTFIKQNWFKVSIMLIFLFCIILIFTLIVRQQDIQKQTQLNSLSSSCEKSALQKKEEMTKNPNDFWLSTYEYKYNPTYKACILAYDGTYSASNPLNKLLGIYQTWVINLTTGQIIMHEGANPGDAYSQTNLNFKKLRDLYIGFTLVE